MKKSLLALLLLVVLFTVSAASAKRYTPDDEIGLFIDQELFRQCLYKSNLGSQITSIERAYKTESYYFENSIILVNSVSLSTSKITSLAIFYPSYTFNREDEEVYTVLGTVLKCTGLLYYEFDDVIKTVREKRTYLNDSYSIFLYEEVDRGDETTVWIDDYYSKTHEDPYSKMSKYNGYCDTNYVGACVPITSKDLECRDIGVRNFFVVGTDKHNFDADRNGVCCEPYAGN